MTNLFNDVPAHADIESFTPILLREGIRIERIVSTGQSTPARVAGSELSADIDPGCVKTLGGITAPGILGSTVMRRAKKRKNLSSARHYDQIRFRFHTTKTQLRHGPSRHLPNSPKASASVPVEALG